jgi:hypothetical protein
MPFETLMVLVAMCNTATAAVSLTVNSTGSYVITTMQGKSSCMDRYDKFQRM